MKTKTKSVLLMSVVPVLLAGAAHAGPIDPLAFSSLGSLSVSSGTLTFNTDTLSITGGGGGLISTTGATQAQGGGNPVVAVFDFSGMDIGSGVSVQVTGSRPIAILSQGDLSIATSLNLSGADGAAGSKSFTEPFAPFGNNGQAGQSGSNGGGAGGLAAVSDHAGGKGRGRWI
jgi:hypothetical protein